MKMGYILIFIDFNFHSCACMMSVEGERALGKELDKCYVAEVQVVQC